MWDMPTKSKWPDHSKYSTANFVPTKFLQVLGLAWNVGTMKGPENPTRSHKSVSPNNQKQWLKQQGEISRKENGDGGGSIILKVVCEGLCDKVVCERLPVTKLCVKELCVTKLCVTKLCVTKM